MFNQDLRSNFIIVFVLAVTLICSGAFAQAAGNRGNRRENNQSDSRGNGRNDNRADIHSDNRGSSQRDNRQVNRGSRYPYRDGRWYSRGWFGWEFAVSALAIGALVETLPPNHSVIVAGNTSYYYDNTRYYRQLPDSTYVVVPTPR